MANKAKKAKRYSVDFKQEAVGRMAGGTTIVGLAKQLGVRRKLLYEWRDRFEAEGRSGLQRRRGRPSGSKSEEIAPPAPSAAELRIAELERLLGRKQLEVDFLKRAFEHIGGAASSQISGGEKETTARSKPRSRSKEKD